MLFKISKESPLVPICLMVLLVVCWMEVDLYAPSFPLLRQYFGTTQEAIQWTLSVNFIGFFVSSLFCGPLSDSYGRRPVLIWGSLIFVFGSLLCIAAPTIEILLAGRLIQGLGVSAPITVCVAVIADIYTGERQVKMMSFVNSAITIVMAMAPLIGAYLSDAFGWRANFMFIFATAILGTLLISFILPETHAADRRQRFSLRQLALNYTTLLRSRVFMATVIGSIFLTTPYFVFIAVIPFLFMEQLQLPLSQYVYYQGSVVSLFAFLSLAIPTMIGKFDADKLNLRSIGLSLIGITVLCMHGMFFADHALTITILMCIYVAGLVWPCSSLFSASLELFPDLRGSATALFMSLRMLVMSLAISLSGRVYNETFMPVGILNFVLVAMAIPLILWAIRLRQEQS